MKKRKILAALAVMGLLCGCSAKPKGHFDLSKRHVTIRTEPAAAKVTQLRPLRQAPLDLGVTPLVKRPVIVLTNIKMKNMPFNEAQKFLDHANNLVVLIEKDGYEPYRATFVTKPNEIVEHSIKLTPKSKNE
ncbi:MAG: hypothetical protein ISS76_09615 [Phycisphaerae bacterium]|nr:hypothetical protein [Phycisphaerae bacterium]